MVVSERTVKVLRVRRYAPIVLSASIALGSISPAGAGFVAGCCASAAPAAAARHATTSAAAALRNCARFIARSPGCDRTAAGGQQGREEEESAPRRRRFHLAARS